MKQLLRIEMVLPLLRAKKVLADIKSGYNSDIGPKFLVQLKSKLNSVARNKMKIHLYHKFTAYI